MSIFIASGILSALMFLCLIQVADLKTWMQTESQNLSRLFCQYFPVMYFDHNYTCTK